VLEEALEHWIISRGQCGERDFEKMDDGSQCELGYRTCHICTAEEGTSQSGDSSRHGIDSVKDRGVLMECLLRPGVNMLGHQAEVMKIDFKTWATTWRRSSQGSLINWNESATVGPSTQKCVSIRVPSGAFISIDGGLRLSVMAEVGQAGKVLTRDGDGYRACEEFAALDTRIRKVEGCDEQ